MANILTKFFGSRNDRELKRIQPIMTHICELESNLQKKSDSELSAVTPHLKEKLTQGASLNEILPEAFAAVREVGKRKLNMRHFDVQLIGGVVLHEGLIAEMRTGEGKTLAATLPLYLNALTGRGCHLVTVNDYLAKRDAEWMSPIYNSLGLSVGSIVHGMDDKQRKEAYGADITYGTNNEFGFDYLRDNMKFRLEDWVQRDFQFCIVDEVDSILIDEARTPLIISGPSDDSTDLYYKIERVACKLKKETDYTVEEKSRSVLLTDDGNSAAEKLLGIDNLYDAQNMEILHHVLAGVKAHALFKRDVDYVVKDGQVVIVDEFTGRLTPGRRWSDGLHQAIEAKEGVTIESENQTLASITYQNYFRMYEKLAGMTGSADTEAVEFKKIYNLEVLVIPTHKKMIRDDSPDKIYKDDGAKFKAVINEIKEKHASGQPVLVGTISVNKSEQLATQLERAGIPHNILNAKNHSREAEIISHAGHQKAVTISTNMAGRGTDIVLGPGVIDLGGLHVLGTERHESRRIDNQLRGRSGRQGDPGSSRFFLSLEDDLLRVFGAGNLKNWKIYKDMGEEDALEHRLLSRAIERAQRKVEGHNFDIRKHLLEYDDVMNQQRNIIYKLRRQILEGEDLKEMIQEYIEERVGFLTSPLKDSVRDDDLPNLIAEFEEAWQAQFGITPPSDNLKPPVHTDNLIKLVMDNYLSKRSQVGNPFEDFERYVVLTSVDQHWKEHLLAMDHLKEGIGLRGYGQKDPLIEYKRDGYSYFLEMLERIKHDVIFKVFHVQVRSDDEVAKLEAKRKQELQTLTKKAPPPLPGKGALQPVTREEKKVGRNDPCPCGSGKKYKKCHGRA